MTKRYVQSSPLKHYRRFVGQQARLALKGRVSRCCRSDERMLTGLSP